MAYTRFPLTVLFNPVNQGYGGNQKIGFHYAIEKASTSSRSFTATGNMRPRGCPICSCPSCDGEADAVFGSRMIGRARTHCAAACRSTSSSATRS